MSTRLTTRTVYRDTTGIIAIEPPSYHSVWLTRPGGASAVVEYPSLWTVFFIRMFNGAQPYLAAVAASTERPRYDTQLLYAPMGNLYHMYPCVGDDTWRYNYRESKDWHHKIHHVVSHWWATRFSNDGSGPSWWTLVGARSRIGGMHAMSAMKLDEVLALDWSRAETKIHSTSGSYGGTLSYPTIRHMIADLPTARRR